MKYCVHASPSSRRRINAQLVEKGINSIDFDDIVDDVTWMINGQAHFATKVTHPGSLRDLADNQAEIFYRRSDIPYRIWMKFDVVKSGNQTRLLYAEDFELGPLPPPKSPLLK